MGFNLKDVVAQDQRCGWNSEDVGLPYWRVGPRCACAVTDRSRGHADAICLDAIEIINRAVTEVIGNHKSDVVGQVVPVEMHPEIVSIRTGSKRSVDGRISSR